MLRLGWVDLALLAGYFAAHVRVGLYSARKVPNVDDYYMGGRRFGKLMMVMFAFGAGTHADFAVGVASQFVQAGHGGDLVPVDPDLQHAAVLVVEPGVPAGALPDDGGFLRDALRPVAGHALRVHGGGDQHGVSGCDHAGCAKLIEALTGGAISPAWSMVLMTVAFVFYSLIGGMIATVWNDSRKGC